MFLIRQPCHRHGPALVTAVSMVTAALLLTGCGRNAPAARGSSDSEGRGCEPTRARSTGSRGAGVRGRGRHGDRDDPTRGGAFRLPKPTGPHPVGTVPYHWTDPTRPEILTDWAGDHREVIVQVWYPAVDRPSTEDAPYLPEAADLIPALGRLFGIPSTMLQELGTVPSHARVKAPVAGTACYPVLVFLEGLGGFRQMNTIQVEELVSHGYVVVAIDQPYTAASVTFPDGRVAAMSSLDSMRPLVQRSYLPGAPAPRLHGRVLERGIVPYLAEDVSFVLDRLEWLNHDDPERILTGRLDLRRVGAFGSSLGGIVAAEAARDEARLDALLLMDAPVPRRTVTAGLDRPAMWITRAPRWMRSERARIGGWSEEEIAAHHGTMRAAFESLRAPGWFVQVPRLSHLDFTDVSSWSPVFASLGATGPMDADRAHRIIGAYSVAFFDLYLGSRTDRLLAGASRRYPDVAVERHVPTTPGGAP